MKSSISSASGDYNNKLDEALSLIESMLQIMSERSKNLKKEERLEISRSIDASIQTFTDRMFDKTNTNVQRIWMGVDALTLQQQRYPKALILPYNLLPKRSLLLALSALTQAAATTLDKNEQHHHRKRLLEESYRILQRLVTGVGIRQKQNKKSMVPEKAFMMVLNAHCEYDDDMHMAHRIMALQERNGPPVTAVAYSILAKGYGKLGNVHNVDMVIEQARSRVEYDSILFNTFVGAYIQCRSYDRAEKLFVEMKDTFPNVINRRSYNILLKGYAEQGDLENAKALCHQMRELGYCDAITTNTLVHAAIVAGDLVYAETILSEHTESMKDARQYQRRKHPNVEAYTQLLDEYMKQNQLDQALRILQVMQQRHVPPNEVTMTCLMGGLGKFQKLDLAQKTIAYMEKRYGNNVGSTKIYNALISGLLVIESSTMDNFDHRVDQAMIILRDMVKAGISPDVITLSVLVDGLGQCPIPRIREAQWLVEHFEQQGVIPTGHPKVITALVRACSRLQDIHPVIQIFRRLENPDTIAVNAFLDACCRCQKDKMAFETFQHYFRQRRSIKPDVISYTVLMSALLKRNTAESIRQLQNLYLEMTMKESIRPDNGLVDLLLKGLVGGARQLSQSDVQFLGTILRDAERLEWQEGQLERRQRAVRAAVTDRWHEWWRKDDVLSRTLTGDIDLDDELFRRKGWNKVDSGFRLWGGGREANAKKRVPTKDVDEFLQAHGWNDVDSSFRLF
jgi:pentatricopeptide repeat protein